MPKNQLVIRKKIYKSKVRRNYSASTWKVAYADFVTTMMAFFLLLWIVSVSNTDTLQGVARYFIQPKSIHLAGGSPSDANTAGQFWNKDNSHIGKYEYGSDKINAKEEKHFINLMNSINQNSKLKQYANNLRVSLTHEGLAIQIVSTYNRPMFKPNTAEAQVHLQRMIDIISKIVAQQPNYISISGHSARIKPTEKIGIDFWLLSSERANEVRKLMHNRLVNKKQIVKIIGKADKEPFDARDPYDISNIRATITLLNKSSISSYQKSLPYFYNE